MHLTLPYQATIVSDIVVMCLLKKRKYYRQNKYQEVQFPVEIKSYILEEEEEE